MDLGIVLDGGCILFSLHVDLSSSHQGFHVVGIQLKGFVEVLQGFDLFPCFHVAESSVGIDDRVEFFVKGVQVQCFSVLGLCCFVIFLFDELVALLLEGFTVFSLVEGLSALVITWVEPASFREHFFGFFAISTVELDNSFEIIELRTILIVHSIE